MRVERSDVLVLDVGGTLLDWVRPWDETLVDRVGPPLTTEVLRATVDDVSVGMQFRDTSTVDAYLADSRRFWGEVIASAGYRGDLEAAVDVAIESYIHSGRQLYPEVHETLAALGARGHRMAVLSNWSPLLESTLEAFGIRRYFECVVCSAVAGFEKPDPRIFHSLLDILNVRAEACVYVGDRYDTDVVGARAVGMRAILFDRSPVHHADDMSRLDCPVIRSLAELVEPDPAREPELPS